VSDVIEQILDPYGLPFWVLIFTMIFIVISILARPFSTYIKFVYPNAKFEAMGNPFIKEKELITMVESKDLSTYIESLNSKKDYTIVGENIALVQDSLDQHFLTIFNMMRKDSTKKLAGFYDTYLEQRDIYHIKNALKKRLVGETKEDETPTLLLSKTQEFLNTIKTGEKDPLAGILQSYGFNEDLIEAISLDPPDFLRIDVAIDRYMIKKFEELKVPYKCENAKQDYIKRLTDLTNIKTILRAKQLGYDPTVCKKLFVGEGQEIPRWKFDELSEGDQPSQIITGLEGTSYFSVLKDALESYNKEKSIQVFEQVLDGFYLKLVKDISLQHYINLGPTLRFLVSKEFEIQNLKAIAKGIGEQLSVDQIKKYLIMEVDR
jgi:V/A-type H+-transporting ATPase subunit C